MQNVLVVYDGRTALVEGASVYLNYTIGGNIYALEIRADDTYDLVRIPFIYGIMHTSMNWVNPNTYSSSEEMYQGFLEAHEKNIIGSLKGISGKFLILNTSVDDDVFSMIYIAQHPIDTVGLYFVIMTTTNYTVQRLAQWQATPRNTN